MTRVMFLCTGNSCRSQMAEGFARKMGGDALEVYSAGIAPAGVNPYAVAVMAEAGMDISGQSSDPVDPALLDGMDLVVTLCGHAEAACPSTPPHVKRLHLPVDDPVRATGTAGEITAAFRKTRDEIRELVYRLVHDLEECGRGRPQRPSC